MNDLRHPIKGLTRFKLIVLLTSLFFIGTGASLPADYTKAEIKEAAKTWKLHSESAKKAYRNHNLSEARASLSLAIKTAEKFGPDDRRLIESWENFAGIAMLQKGYADAAAPMEKVLAARQKKLGDKHKDVYWTMAQLGEIYAYLRQHEKAEPLILKSLEGVKKRHGAKHSSVGKLYGVLGMAYLIKRDYVAAEDCLKQALAIAESQRRLANYRVPIGLTKYSFAKSIFGPNQIDLAAARNNLALLYKKQGRFAEAEKLFKDAIEGIEKITWKGSPHILGELQNLRNLYLKNQNYAKAEEIILQEKGIRELAKQSSPADATLLIGLYSVWIDNPEASAKRAELMKPLKERFKVDAEEPIADLPELTNHLVSRGDLKSASMVAFAHFANQFLLLPASDPKLFEIIMQTMDLLETTREFEPQAIIIDLVLYDWEHELEKNDERLLIMRARHAGILIHARKLADAEYALNGLIPKLETTVGSNTTIVAMAWWHHGELKHLQGDLPAAFSFYENAFATSVKSGNTNEQFSIDLLQRLVTAGVSLKTEHAVDYLNLLLPILEKKFGPEHTELVDPLLKAGDFYWQQDKPAEAAIFYTRSLTIQSTQRGADNIVLVPTIEKLLPVYAKQGRVSELELLYQQRVAIYEKTFGLKHPSRIRATQDYAAWLRAQGREDDAAKLLTE